MQGRPVERERRVDHGFDVGRAGIAITAPRALGQRAYHVTLSLSSHRVCERLTARPLLSLIAVRCGTRKGAHAMDPRCKVTRCPIEAVPVRTCGRDTTITRHRC